MSPPLSSERGAMRNKIIRLERNKEEEGVGTLCGSLPPPLPLSLSSLYIYVYISIFLSPRSLPLSSLTRTLTRSLTPNAAQLVQIVSLLQLRVVGAIYAILSLGCLPKIAYLPLR